MAGIDDIIGGWVRDAERSGEVKSLPGYGKPLDLDEDKHVPTRYRMAYRVLKNSGHTPPEVQMIQKVAELKSALEIERDDLSKQAILVELSEAQQKLDVALDKFRSGR